MITTITTAITSAAAIAAATSLVLIAVTTLLLLLIQKEIVGDFKSDQARRLSQALNVSLIPLTIVFVTALIIRLVDTLR